MSATSHAIHLVPARPVQRPPSQRALLARQLPVIREMLGTFDTLTIAGQRHLMEKVVGFVDSKTRAVGPRMSNRNRATLLELLTRLRQESQRLVPDPVCFTRHAENLITLLDAVD
ncbi:MAG TPA: hypothetical protein VHO06_01800 [Polyangia bacterium]|nr:hypothetical protein [Polyangia bacterium]